MWNNPKGVGLRVKGESVLTSQCVSTLVTLALQGWGRARPFPRDRFVWGSLESPPRDSNVLPECPGPWSSIGVECCSRAEFVDMLKHPSLQCRFFFFFFNVTCLSNEWHTPGVVLGCLATSMMAVQERIKWQTPYFRTTARQYSRSQKGVLKRQPGLSIHLLLIPISQFRLNPTSLSQILFPFWCLRLHVILGELLILSQPVSSTVEIQSLPHRFVRKIKWENTSGHLLGLYF